MKTYSVQGLSANGTADKHEFGVPWCGVLISDWFRGPWVEPMEEKPTAIGQLNPRMNRRNIVLHQKFHLRIDQAQAGEESHAIVIRLWPADHVWVSSLKRLELCFPPGINFDGQDEIRVGFLYGL